jgi:hypothetical protein
MHVFIYLFHLALHFCFQRKEEEEEKKVAHECHLAIQSRLLSALLSGGKVFKSSGNERTSHQCKGDKGPGQTTAREETQEQQHK